MIKQKCAWKYVPEVNYSATVFNTFFLNCHGLPFLYLSFFIFDIFFLDLRALLVQGYGLVSIAVRHGRCHLPPMRNFLVT
jgi:hypothetical protein